MTSGQWLLFDYLLVITIIKHNNSNQTLSFIISIVSILFGLFYFMIFYEITRVFCYDLFEKINIDILIRRNNWKTR